MSKLYPGAPNLNEPTYDLPIWEEDIDVSDFSEEEEKPTEEHGVISIPREAYRSDALLSGAGTYFVHRGGNR